MRQTVFSSEIEKNLETLNIETQAVTRVNFNIVFDRFVDLIVQTVDKHAPSKKKNESKATKTCAKTVDHKRHFSLN